MFLKADLPNIQEGGSIAARENHGGAGERTGQAARDVAAEPAAQPGGMKRYVQPAF